MSRFANSFIDATEGGIAIKNTISMPFGQALKKYCLVELEFPELPRNTDHKKIVSKYILGLERGREFFKQLKLNLISIHQDAAFTLSEISAALEQANISGKPDFELSDKLIDLINSIPQRHNKLICLRDQDLPELTSTILDTIMAKGRLQLHSQRIKELALSPGMNQARSIMLKLTSHLHESELMVNKINGILEELDTVITRMQQFDINSTTLGKFTADEILLLAESCLSSMDLIEAQFCFWELLKYDPDNSKARFGLGRTFIKLRKPDRAMEEFNIAEKIEPGLNKQITRLIADFSNQSLIAAKDRLKRKRTGAKGFLLNILPGFPDYEEANRLLVELE
jgi:tetratricopeptide (TPR) repeat protein